MFFASSSKLRTSQLQRLGRRIRHKTSRWCILHTHAWRGVCYLYILRGLSVLLILPNGQRRPWVRNKLVQQPALFYGRTLRQWNTARPPSGCLLRLSRIFRGGSTACGPMGRVNMPDRQGGYQRFHSPLEKRVIDILLEHKHPVIIALCRALYNKIPSHLQSAFDEERLLFV